MACRAPSEFKLTPPSVYPQDLPFAVALTTDEYDPWTESSHKFRLYEQPILLRSDPSEVDVGTISEVFVYADDSTEFFDPLPTIRTTQIDSEGNALATATTGVGNIMC